MDEQKKTEIDILKKDLENRFTEIMFHSQRFHSQTNLVYIYLSAIVSLAIVSFSDEAQKLFQNLSRSEIKVVFMVVLILGVIIQYYIGSLILDSLYMIYANGGRIADIEKEINKRLGSQLLKWDSEIIPKMYDMKYWHYKTWIKPGYIVSAWAVLIWIINAISLIILWLRIVGDYFPLFLAIMGTGTIFHAYQWIVLQTAGIEFINKVVSGEPLISETSYPTSTNIKVLAPALTLILGIIPFVILSIKTESFWLDSNYNFPLTALPSIWVGDTFILPTLNYFIASTIIHSKSLLQASKKKLYLILLISTLVALIINSYTHYSWVQDSYTGFMDTTIGKLSLAGWWHFGFSILQMVIVLFFLGIWVMLLKRANLDVLIRFENTWKVFIAFTSVSILDFIVKDLIVFKTPISNISFLQEIDSFTALFFSVLVFLSMMILRRTKRIKKGKTA